MVEFLSPTGVRGLAFRESGFGESLYEVDTCELAGTKAESVDPGGTVGEFDVVGQVVRIDDDGAIWVASKGFDFIVDADAGVSPSIGVWMHLRIKRFTLYL